MRAICTETIKIGAKDSNKERQKHDCINGQGWIRKRKLRKENGGGWEGE